jgi:protein-L-isoaspartate(D-aspartate) O-methyltransferase
MLTYNLTSDTEKHRLINLLSTYGIREPVLSAFDAVPREKFINKKVIGDHYKNEELASLAYEDRALPIGMGQTITQPSLVASMVQALGLKGKEKVLEIGTGSGFHAAILSRLAWKIYTIERIKQLADEARLRLADLGIKNVEVLDSDGSDGAQQYAPYDVISASAAAAKIPEPLVRQLRDGGTLLIPLRGRKFQEVTLYEKKKGGLRKLNKIAPVSFVPFIGEHSWPEN